ncbi:hypothetical protein B0H21DRAFT_723596 [Amylocystis lapponica]|nr:hypothetical protein B0H21DRAFT_723596 [Amylocystis lapponica]
MNGTLGLSAKPLPPVAKDEKLPPPPPKINAAGAEAPAPPSKVVFNPDPEPETPSRPAQLDVSGSMNSGVGSGPLTPNSIASSSSDSKPKRSNPLIDLIETEKLYVDLLTGIIRKIAAAWSRSNLPPPELDTMFRSIEGIYKANRVLLSKLKEIGNNPSSPKALGDLLMRWIDDLETPYTTYCTNYSTGFDTWEPVQSNSRLRTVLAMFSSTNPPPLPASAPAHPAEPPIWTLDELFLLPKSRLKYYKKLYARLLKSTTPGRSDHRLLTGALEKLDKLGATLDSRAIINVAGSAAGKGPLTPALPEETEDEVVIDMRLRDSTLPKPFAVSNAALAPQRSSDSTHGSSSGSRRSEDTAPTSEDRTSTATMSMPINDLERRLATDRTLDIFSMKPKEVRLQISPPTLHYTRELRLSADVLIAFTPKSSGVEVVQQRGHLFILTDLLLVCERMTPEEKAQSGPDGADMWLSYPPLAGKHLRVAPLDGSDTALSVVIMRKETLTVHASSRGLRDKLVAEFRECIDTAATMMPSSKNTPPPVPQLPPMDNLSRQQPPGHGPPMHMPPEHQNNVGPPSRALSPSSTASRNSSEPVMHPIRASSELSERVHSVGSMNDRMPRYGGPPDPHMQYGHPVFPPPRSASSGVGPGPASAPLSRGPSFGPSQVAPPQSFNPGQVMPPQSFNVGQVMPQHGPPSGPGYSQGMSGRPGPGQFTPGGPQRGPPPHGPPYGPPGHATGHPAPFAHPPPRPPSDPAFQGGLRKSTSSRSLASQYEQASFAHPPPMPNYPGEYPPPRPGYLQRSGSSTSLPSLGAFNAPPSRPILPSAQLSMRSLPAAGSFQDPSPPGSPVEETAPYTGPTTSKISAQMKCKVFLKQQHEQWKSLGAAKLKLYHESPTNVKQLVVEADNRAKSVMISTIVLADGVERVGKTGVAVELSDRGRRSGVIYMLQLRNESSAGGLFDSLLAGSDRFIGKT